MKEKKLTITSKDITPKQWSVLILELNMMTQHWKKYATLEINTPGFNKVVSWGKRRYDAKN